MPSCVAIQATPALFQSAPAIAGGRCEYRAAVTKLADEFQSAPAIAGGRCRYLRLAYLVAIRFNPRPPLLAGDAALMMGRSTNVLFQSAPAIAGGRCRPSRARCCRRWRFNPRPPLLAGDADVFWSRAHWTAVSIRARHCWRAMHASAIDYVAKDLFQSAPAIAGGRCQLNCEWLINAWMFQSAPAIAGGRCERSRQPGRVHEVSIRARHCWRAMPSWRVSARRSRAFQSAPAIAGGRCHPGHAGQQRCTGFNPRPPLLAGDARKPGRSTWPTWVSIRARHCWRAMHDVFWSRAHWTAVSIRARHCWRAMQHYPRGLTACVRSFNPRPPLLAGDARQI